MLNNMNDTVSQLVSIGLGNDEAKLYLELLRGPSTHQQLSRSTGINRTKVYRLAEQLEKRSLIGRRVDDRGTFLVASDPSALEVDLVAHEGRLKMQREILHDLGPRLAQLQGKDSRAFVVRTYEGNAGLKQMCWHELHTNGELLSLGYGTLEALSGDKKWAAQHRKRQILAGYKAREIVNHEYGGDPLPELAASQLIDAKLYDFRVLPTGVLLFDNQTIIYNETVAIYHWKQDQKIGLEIISPTYAQMMRQMFEHYWELASKPAA
jgi:DNA-binding MarR family transcriptional regulator